MSDVEREDVLRAASMYSRPGNESASARNVFISR